MILKKKYFIICIITVSSLLLQISSIDYITRLAQLILVFIMSGLIYIVQDLKFQGLTYIIVYVGAISILFLFVLKKTESGRAPNVEINPKNYKRKAIFKNSTYSGVISISMSLQKVGVLSVIYKAYIDASHPNINKDMGESIIYYYYIPSFITEFITFNDIESLGYILYLGYPFIIILIGILLWCVLLGIQRISGQR